MNHKEPCSETDQNPDPTISSEDPFQEFASSLQHILADHPADLLTSTSIDAAIAELRDRMRQEQLKRERQIKDLTQLAANAQRDLRQRTDQVKRMEREQAERDDKTRQQLGQQLMQIADSFDAAFHNCDDADASWIQGFRLIAKQIERALSELDFERFNALGAQFDHLMHEAVSTMQTADHTEGTILEVVREGYRHRSSGATVRPALVITAARHIDQVAPADTTADAN